MRVDRLVRHSADGRRHGLHDRARGALAEVDEGHELLGGCVGGRGQDAVPPRPPSVSGPTGHQVTDVDGEGVGIEGRVLPAALVRPDLEPALAGLPVEDGDGAEVGVRADAELARLRLPDDLRPRIPVDVETVGRVIHVPGEEVRSEAEGLPEQGEQPLLQFGHPGQVLLAEPLELRHLRRPDVGRVPLRVDHRVVEGLVRGERQRLLQVRRGLRPLRIPVGLRAGSQPASPAHLRGVRLLDVDGQREERPRRLPDPVAQGGIDPVPGDQQETGGLESVVDGTGDVRAGPGVTVQPGPQVDGGDTGGPGVIHRCPRSREPGSSR